MASTSTTATTTCFFNDCKNPVLPGSWKCAYHRRRARCLVQECTNQVHARNLCVRHGGQKTCQFEGCCMNARIRGFCYKHGGKDNRRRCAVDGCTRNAAYDHKCIAHGGGRRCTTEGCSAHVRKQGLCGRHYRQTMGDVDAKTVLLSPCSATSTASFLDALFQDLIEDEAKEASSIKTEPLSPQQYAWPAVLWTDEWLKAGDC